MWQRIERCTWNTMEAVRPHLLNQYHQTGTAGGRERGMCTVVATFRALVVCMFSFMDEINLNCDKAMVTERDRHTN